MRGIVFEIGAVKFDANDIEKEAASWGAMLGEEPGCLEPPTPAPRTVGRRVLSAVIASIRFQPASLPSLGSLTRHPARLDVHRTTFAALFVLGGPPSGVVRHSNVVDTPIPAPKRVPANTAAAPG